MADLRADLIRGARGASEYSGIPERAIYHMVEAGQLPAIRKGRAFYFRKSDLETAFSLRDPFTDHVGPPDDLVATLRTMLALAEKALALADKPA